MSNELLIVIIYLINSQNICKIYANTRRKCKYFEIISVFCEQLHAQLGNLVGTYYLVLL